MNSRRHALARARRFRTCPPMAPAGMPDTRTRIAAHRRQCPLCAAPDGGSPWQDIAARLAASVPDGGDGPDIVPAGALCPVKPDRAHWRGHLYYSPPLVVVCDMPAHHPDAIEVVQVYHDPLLAAPGDLLLDLDDADGDDLGPVFIECWNRYTLRRNDLCRPVVRLGAQIVAAVRAMAADPAMLPDWAPLPVPLGGENDPRLAFRRMEVEVGYAFASAAVSTLLRELEGTVPLAPTEEVQAALRRLTPGVVWGDPPEDPETALCSALWPADSYPLAAAAGMTLPVCARRVAVGGGLPVSVVAVAAGVTQIETLPGRLAVSGTLEDPTVSDPRSRLLAAAVLAEGGRRRCDVVDWDFSTGIFYAELPAEEGDPVRLELTVLVTSDHV